MSRIIFFTLKFFITLDAYNDCKSFFKTDKNSVDSNKWMIKFSFKIFLIKTLSNKMSFA